MAVPKLSIDEMVEVFELRVKGVCWENLSIIFNVSETTLKKYFRAAQREGYSLWRNSDKVDQEVEVTDAERVAHLENELQDQAAQMRAIIDELIEERDKAVSRITELESTK